MGKFIIIQDMRHMPSYKNVNARLLYMHMAMGCDISTYEYKSSLRRLALDLDMTVDTIRYAMKQLVRDGLVTPQITPQSTPHTTPQTTPQTTPHLTTYRINKNGTPNGTPNTTPYTTPYTTENTTENTTVKNNKNNINHESSPLTSARVAWADMRGMLRKALDLDAATAAATVDLFKERQDMKGKTWKDEGDLKAHLIAWAEKRLASLPRQQKAARQTDAQAREAERQRAKEAAAEKTERVKLWEQMNQVKRFIKEVAAKQLKVKDPKEREQLTQILHDQKAALEDMERRFDEMS